MNKFPLILSAALSLSACKAEEVKVTDINHYSARAVSEILEVNDTYLTQQIPEGYLPESCESKTVPGSYSDPVSMIIYTTVQMTCTQKFGETQYQPISEVVPEHLYDHGVVDVTQFVFITSNGVEQILVAPSGKFNAEVGDICSVMSSYISACR